MTVSVGPAIQFKPIEGYAPAADGDLRQMWPNRAVEEVLVSPHQHIAYGYGTPLIELDLPGLRKAIRSGEVTGVAILNPTRVQRQIMAAGDGCFEKIALSWARRDTEYLVYGVVPERFIKVGCVGS